MKVGSTVTWTYEDYVRDWHGEDAHNVTRVKHGRVVSFDEEYVCIVIDAEKVVFKKRGEIICLD